MEAERSASVDINEVNKNITEKHLRNSSVSVKKSSFKRTLNILKCTWCVGNYCELQTGVTYEKVEEKAYYSCTFQLEKTQKDLVLSVVICGNLVENCCVQVYIGIASNTSPDSEDSVADNTLNSEIKRAVEETKGKFILKFPSQTLATRIACQKVPLYILYHCITRSKDKSFLFWTGRIGKKSAAEMSRDISFEKNRLQFFDFRIKTLKRVFLAHKCILAARSRYFLEYFKRQDECQCESMEANVNVTQMEVDALPGIVWYVLCYMYSGQIDALDINSMIRIYHLAEKWKVLSLMDDCSNYLRLNMDLKDTNKAKELELDVECFGLSEVTKLLQKLKLSEETK